MISVYDIEVYKNLFTCTFKNIKTLQVTKFVVSEWQNDFEAFVAFFLQHEGLIGYNNYDYDYKVLHPFISEPEEYRHLEGVLLTDLIHKRSDLVISETFKEGYVEPLVPQRDLYRVWHFNNRAKAISLKYLEINIGWKNVMETPIDFTAKVKQEEIPIVLDYNENDVEATYAFYLLSLGKLKLRKNIGDKYGVKMGNFSDNRIGETIFLKEIARRTGRSEKSIKEGRTPRKTIPVRDCLVDGISFTTPEFNKVLDIYKNKTITNTKKLLSKAKKNRKDDIFVYLDGTKYEFGMGGLHALRAPGVYYNIHSADVSSYYPNFSINYKVYPQHLGPAFCEAFKVIYDQKVNSVKGSDDNTAYKAALVCAFGSSNAPWSMFYDPKFTMSTTLNGQLILAMLCERIVTSGAGRVIMANTDGIEVDVKDETLYKQVCDTWQKETGLLLEFTKYRQIAIRDVNAYHAIDIKGKVKNKGDFEIEKDLHKDHSHRIVPIAVDAYFKDGTLPETTVNNCKDIGKFLIGKRARSGKLEYRTTDASGGLIVEKLSKNIRYYVSRSGGSIVKVTRLTPGQLKKRQEKAAKLKIATQYSMFDEPVAEVPNEEKITTLHVGYRMTMFNKWIEKDFELYNLEKQFYVREAYKLINSVIQNQTSI